ncbi:MAG: RuvA C-terminal domain-containing protein [Polyangiaceae bacterium]
MPFALGGAATVKNLCVLCASHNGYTARRVYGAEFIARKRAEQAAAQGGDDSDVQSCTVEPVALAAGSASVEGRDADSDTGTGSDMGTGSDTEAHGKAHAALVHLGFRAREVMQALERLGAGSAYVSVEQLLRGALLQLTPPVVQHARTSGELR